MKQIAGNHIGYSLYVRVKYLKPDHHWIEFREDKFGYTKWSMWRFDGQNGKGNFFYREDISPTVVRKAMEWRERLYIRQGL